MDIQYIDLSHKLLAFSFMDLPDEPIQLVQPDSYNHHNIHHLGHLGDDILCVVSKVSLVMQQFRGGLRGGTTYT